MITGYGTKTCEWPILIHILPTKKYCESSDTDRDTGLRSLNFFIGGWLFRWQYLINCNCKVVQCKSEIKSSWFTQHFVELIKYPLQQQFFFFFANIELNIYGKLL